MDKRVSVWSWVWSKTDGGNIDAVVTRLRAAGVTMLIGPKAWDSGAWMTEINWKQIRDALKAKMPELAIYAWGYCWYQRRNNVAADAQRAIECVTYGLADGLVLDVEAEFEGRSDAAEALCRPIRAALPNTDILYSAFALPAYHGPFPYAVFEKYCNGLVPQLYFKYWTPPTGNLFANAAAAVDAMVAQHRAIGIGPEKLLVAADCWAEPQHPMPTKDELVLFGTRCRETGCAGVSAWDYQEMDAATWVAMKAMRDAFLPVVPKPDELERLRRELAVALTERDDLRRQVEALISERDVLKLTLNNALVVADNRIKALRSLETLVSQSRGVLSSTVDSALDAVINALNRPAYKD